MTTMNISAQNATTVIKVVYMKEKRKCSSCNQEGHNKRTCPSTPPASAPTTPPLKPQPLPQLQSKPLPFLLPREVAWQPGTDSLAWHARMSANPAYSYDKTRNTFVLRY